MQNRCFRFLFFEHMKPLAVYHFPIRHEEFNCSENERRGDLKYLHNSFTVIMTSQLRIRHHRIFLRRSFRGRIRLNWRGGSDGWDSKDAAISKSRNSSSSVTTMDVGGGDIERLTRRFPPTNLRVRLCVIIKWLLLSFSCYYNFISFTSVARQRKGRSLNKFSPISSFPPPMNIQAIINKRMFTLFLDFHSSRLFSLSEYF